MKSKSNIALVTGGAGFIGSHLAEKLAPSLDELRIVDNLSEGRLENLMNLLQVKSVTFSREDISSSDRIRELLVDVDTVYHLASYAEVRTGLKFPSIPFQENLCKTHALLEEIRKSSSIKRILFTSSSTVYGLANKIPTSEEYGPLVPISHYGASKLACEAFLSSYCSTYGIDLIVFRLANIIGTRSRRGIIMDFFTKLRSDPKRLEILGNGKQSKSYLHISDCVDGILRGSCAQANRIEIFNVGNYDIIDVTSIGRLVSQSLALTKVELTYSNTEAEGWIGDVPLMQLDVAKLKRTGWTPLLSSEQAVQKSINELKGEMITNIGF